MQIQAYRRTERTVVNLFGVDILFALNTANHVVAEVEDERACDRLLSISEAYREYLGEGQPIAASVDRAAAPADAPVSTPPATDGEDDGGNDDGDKVFDTVLLGSEDLPPEFAVGEATLTQADVVDRAFARSGMNREEWNLNDQDDREALIEGEVVKLLMEHDARVQAAAADLAAAESPAAKPQERVVEDTPKPAETAEVPTNPLLLTGPNGETLDLGTYSEPKLREFAKAQGITLPGGKSTKVGDLRLMVAKALTSA